MEKNVCTNLSVRTKNSKNKLNFCLILGKVSEDQRKDIKSRRRVKGVRGLQKSNEKWCEKCVEYLHHV